MPLGEALTRRWGIDQHFVLYTSSQPYRINNAAVEKGIVEVEVRLLAVDVDHHHDPPGWLERDRPKICALLAAHPGFVHTTRGGWRALYALPRPIPIRGVADKEAFALLYARIAGYLFNRFGIVCDDALIRWNQPIRLPHVMRDGRPLRAQILGGDPHAISVFSLPDEVPAVPELRGLAAVQPRWETVAKRWQPVREHVRAASLPSFDDFDESPQPHAARIAEAKKWAASEAPRAIMGLRGRATASSVAALLLVGFALDRSDVEKILTGPYNMHRCVPPWSDDELGDLRKIAGTVAQTPTNPRGFLLSEGADRTGIAAARAALAVAAEARNIVPLEEIPERLVAAVQAHKAIVLRATYGAGKTYTMAQYVAGKTSCRVLVVVPRHDLARAWVKALKAAGETSIAYHASVVQRRDEQGRRHCTNKYALRLYRSGGDVVRDICPGCKRAASCPAYATRLDGRSRVHVLPREMLAKLEVTDEDLVVFDDAATDLLAWHRVRIKELRRLTGADERILPASQLKYLKVFLWALFAGPWEAEESARIGLRKVGLAVPEKDVLRHVAVQLAKGQRSPRLPSDLPQGEQVEANEDIRRLHDLLRFARAYAEGGEVTWSEKELAVHGETLATSILRTHRGRLVVLDAAANVEELGKLRSDWHVERLDVEDAGDVSRTLLFVPNANRKTLKNASGARKALDAWLPAVLERLTARGVRRPVLVAYKALRKDLRAHPALRAWCAAEPRRTVRVAHYGAVRGSNRWARCDAIVTLGDHWLHGDDVLGRAERLGLDEPSYRIALATAELGQAHGRSRSARRNEPLTHLHVGRLVPDGWGSGAA